MAKNKETPPFLKSIKHIMELRGVDFSTALDNVQSTYSNFKNRNDRLLERQISQSNTTQVQLISHFALLATLTLTVVGIFLSQIGDGLTSNQELLVLIILSFEIISLSFGAFDYLQTIKFHNKWAELYQSIDNEAESKLATGELQWTNQLNDIEVQHLKMMPESTKKWVTYIMVTFCITGLSLLLLLFIANFYNIPFVK